MRNSFEGASLESAEIDQIHKKAEQILQSDMFSEMDFVEPYGEDKVAEDLERVSRIEADFVKKTPQEQELKKVADIFEALVLWNGEQSNWFGEGATTIKTSKYDDYVNGVDAVIEFEGNDTEKPSYLGLAADVTFSTDTTKKFERLRGQIDRGQLAKVKYFHSEHMNIHGQLGRLPEVIIGADKKTVLEVGEMWVEKQFKELAKHRLQIMILVQIRE